MQLRSFREDRADFREIVARKLENRHIVKVLTALERFGEGGVRVGHTPTQAAGISTRSPKGHDDVNGSDARESTGRREGAAGR